MLPDPRDPDGAVGVANATLYRTEDGGRTLTDSSAGFTGYAWGWFTCAVAYDAIDRAGGFAPGDGRVVLATAGGYWNQVLVRSEDEGRTWTIVDPVARHHLWLGLHPVRRELAWSDSLRSEGGGRSFRRMEGLPDRAALVGACRARPDTPYAMNAARTELWRSDDAGGTWRLWSRPGWAFRKLDSKPTFAACPENPDRVYSIDARGDLAVFDGSTWRSLGVLPLAGGVEEQRNHVRAVAVDPRRPEILYAACEAAGRPFVFCSADGGRTWQDISANLPRIGAGGLSVHPLTGDVFLGGVTGTRLLPPPYPSPGSLWARLRPEGAISNN